MKGDFSKDSFHPEKHFHDVLMQQGRVLLDAEWNEQASLNAYRTETGVRDIVGKSGTPFDELNPNGGFQLVPANGNTDVTITKGHYYVDGILCENESDVLYVDQPDLNSEKLPSTNTNGNGDYLFYLDVWQRHITVLEDPAIREVALGGPDTTTRIKTIWQVKWNGPAPVNCANALDNQITAAPTGKLMARSKAPESSSDPCGLAESGGYTRLENQLYRAEIHIGGANRANSTFKWSRDNGIVIAKWESQDSADPTKLVVSTIGRDEILNFKEGEWIEIIDERTDLLGKPGILAELQRVEGNTIFIKSSSIKDPDNPGTTSISILNRKNPRIRRWDSVADIKLSAAWIPLEDGVEVKFDEGTFRTGDFWLIPARTAIADVEWPFTQSQLPFGVKHHYALLGILNLNAGVWSVVSDCRPLFPPLTDLTSLFYVSGDGQEAMPGNTLPKPIVVGVSNGQWPVKNARVKFSLMTAGVGSINVPANGIVFTNNQGLASCDWTLGGVGTASSQQVKAELLDAAGNPMHLPVIFTANQSIASNVFYDGGDCQNWGTNKPANVADALTALCKRTSEGDCCSITVGEEGEYKTIEEALNDLKKKKVLDVSLCLLPGDHRIDKNIRIKEDQDIKFRTIHIIGYAAYITMTAEMIELSANKIVLEGFSLKLDKDAIKSGGIILNAPSEINIDHCEFFRGGDSLAPFIMINKTAMLYLKNSKIISLGATILENGVQGVIESNLISFLILQNIKPGSTAPLLWNADVKKTTRSNLEQKPAEFMRLTDWSLTIRGNFFSAVLTDVARPFPQDIYKNLIVSENLFALNNNSFVAQYINIAHNHFLFEQQIHGGIINAFVVGVNVVIMGNKGATRGDKILTAIEVITLGMIIGLQQLNLLDIRNN